MIAGVLFELIGPRAPMGASSVMVVLVCVMVIVRVYEGRPEAGR